MKQPYCGSIFRKDKNLRVLLCSNRFRLARPGARSVQAAIGTPGGTRADTAAFLTTISCEAGSDSSRAGASRHARPGRRESRQPRAGVHARVASHFRQLRCAVRRARAHPDSLLWQQHAAMRSKTMACAAKVPGRSARGTVVSEGIEVPPTTASWGGSMRAEHLRSSSVVLQHLAVGSDLQV